MARPANPLRRNQIEHELQKISTREIDQEYAHELITIERESMELDSRGGNRLGPGSPFQKHTLRHFHGNTDVSLTYTHRCVYVSGTNGTSSK